MRTIRTLVVLGWLAAAGIAHAGMRIYPASPVPGQDFVVMLDSHACLPATDLAVSVVGSTIYLDYRSGTGCFGITPPLPPLGFVVRVAQPGSYLIVERLTAGSTTSFVGVPVTVKEGSTSGRPAYSLAGLWWVPSQPGWALNVVEGSGGQLFLVWYAYAPTADTTSTRGPSTWYYVSGGQWTGGNTFTGAIAASLGSPLSLPFDPTVRSSAVVGLGTLTVTSQDTLLFTVDPQYSPGYPASLQLTRYRF